MYTLVSAIAKSRTGAKRWSELDIADMALNDLFKDYSRVVATLSNEFIEGNVSFELESIRSTHGGRTITFNEFLEELGNTALTTSTTLLEINTRYVKYNSAVRAGYKAQISHPTAGEGTEYPRADLTYLTLTRPDTDYGEFVSYCLVNVNGFYHFVDSTDDGIFVQDGNASCLKCNRNELGILSFLNVGEITCMKITDEMFYKQNDDQVYADRVRLNLGVNISNKVVMLVLGGYLHALDPHVFHRINDTCISIDIGKIPLLERYYESRDILDLTSLPLNFSSHNDRQIATEEFYSDENIKAYLQLSQSFIVLVDAPEIFTEKSFLKPTKTTDFFICHEQPMFPLVVASGKHANYWATYEEPRYGVRSRETRKKNYLFNQTNPRATNSLDDKLNVTQPKTQFNAFFLKIGRDI